MKGSGGEVAKGQALPPIPHLLGLVELELQETAEKLGLGLRKL